MHIGLSRVDHIRMHLILGGNTIYLTWRKYHMRMCVIRIIVCDISNLELNS